MWLEIIYLIGGRAKSPFRNRFFYMLTRNEIGSWFVNVVSKKCYPTDLGKTKGKKIKRKCCLGFKLHYIQAKTIELFPHPVEELCRSWGLLKSDFCPSTALLLETVQTKGWKVRERKAASQMCPNTILEEMLVFNPHTGNCIV